MSQSQGPRPFRRWIFAALWVLSALLIAGDSKAPNALVRVLDSRDETVLEPAGTWSVPVLHVSAIDQWASWPYWLYVLSASLFLAIVGWQMLSRDVPTELVYVAILGLSLLARAEHLALAVLLLLTVGVLFAKWSLPRKGLAISACLGLSLLVTIEFGLVWIIALLLFAPEFWQGSSKRVRGLTLLALIVVFAGAFWRWPGFAAAMLRPVSWIGRALPDSIFLSAPFSTGEDWRVSLLLLVFFLYCWLLLFWKPKEGLRYLLPVCFLTLLGFGQAGSLWIAGLALALIFRVSVQSELSPRIGQMVLAAALIFAVIRFLPRSGTYLDVALGEGTPPLVEPADWGIEGRVMLLDLNQSVDWQHAKTREHFQLLLDDRQEIFAGQYADYAAACRDMREILADSYLRNDQEWGGYKRWLNEYSPTLLVANSANVWDIRRLSLSPHWRVMGIDSRRTILGYAKDAQNYPQSARALSMLTQLEWPPLAPASLPDNVIAASTPDELLKVSRVLNALRFPYAALRLLPGQDTPLVHRHRAWCHLEIAHRVYRHSGQGSVLDQFRGVHGLRQMLSESDQDPEEILRGLSSLEGLGLERLASELAHEWQQADPSLSDEQRERFESLKSRTKTAVQTSRADPRSSDAEARIRIAFLEGDRMAVEQELEHLEKPQRDYYALLSSAWDVSATELSDGLSALLEQPDFPEHRLGEALFYQGCLALETGRSEAAVSAFRESARVEPDSPFHALREMYRLQMGDQ